MVIKISKRSDVGGVVDYNTRKVEEGKAKILSSSLISSKDDEALTKADIIEGFSRRLSLNDRTKNTMTHISLNPSPEEDLSDMLLVKIAEDFIEQLGYERQPYVVVKHSDIEREHVHIILCNIDENGQKINDKYEKKRCNAIRKGIENKYGLVKAEGEQQTKRYAVQTADAKKGHHYDQLRDIAGGIAKDYIYGSVDHYRLLCQAHNIVAEVSGDDKHGKAEFIYGIGPDFASPPIKGSEFDEEAGLKYKDIAKRAEENKEKVRQHCASTALREVVRGLMASDNLDSLRKQSVRLGLDFHFRTKDDGRVYGLTIIDHKKKAVFNASDLGRDLSARHWQKFFGDAATGGEPLSLQPDEHRLSDHTPAAFEPEATPVATQSHGTPSQATSSPIEEREPAEPVTVKGDIGEVMGEAYEPEPMPLSDDGELTIDDINAIINVGYMIDTSMWRGGGSKYRPDEDEEEKKKKKRKKKHI